MNGAERVHPRPAPAAGPCSTARGKRSPRVASPGSESWLSLLPTIAAPLRAGQAEPARVVAARAPRPGARGGLAPGCSGRPARGWAVSPSPAPAARGEQPGTTARPRWRCIAASRARPLVRARRVPQRRGMGGDHADLPRAGRDRRTSPISSTWPRPASVPNTPNGHGISDEEARVMDPLRFNDSVGRRDELALSSDVQQEGSTRSNGTREPASGGGIIETRPAAALLRARLGDLPRVAVEGPRSSACSLIGCSRRCCAAVDDAVRVPVPARAVAEPWTWTVGALAVAFQPMFGFMAGGVHPDNLFFAASAALLFGARARVPARPHAGARGAAIGAALAVGVPVEAQLRRPAAGRARRARAARLAWPRGRAGRRRAERPSRSRSLAVAVAGTWR